MQDEIDRPFTLDYLGFGERATCGGLSAYNAERCVYFTFRVTSEAGDTNASSSPLDYQGNIAITLPSTDVSDLPGYLEPQQSTQFPGQDTFVVTGCDKSSLNDCATPTDTVELAKGQSAIRYLYVERVNKSLPTSAFAVYVQSTPQQPTHTYKIATGA